MIINNRKININQAHYIIAELSANHNSSIDRAFENIKTTKEVWQMQLKYKP